MTAVPEEMTVAPSCWFNPGPAWVGCRWSLKKMGTGPKTPGLGYPPVYSEGGPSWGPSAGSKDTE